MDILALEQRRLDPVTRRARFHEAESRRDAFLHHVAELAGRLDLALARRGDAFNGEEFAANRGPREARHRPDLRLILAHAVLESAHAGKVAEILRRDRNGLGFAFEDLAQALARQPSDLALERANACLARVIAD